ncbi:AT-hook motif nuclear-localized protein 1-like [Lotus japonicus]|uniref:AT-hook motif nuclear-localized protein 1-like n=1 Tax=Lotus japonicus TaxID=34305 RepID=UPI002582BF71|nr:AT-hook motif nuclear-localized protein 1-like [Lotus japonicus]
MEDFNQIDMMSHIANSSKNELKPNKEEVMAHTATGDSDIAPHVAQVEVALKLVAGEASEASVSAGRGFTSHVVDVNTGEDVMSKIAPFYQAGPLSVSLLFAHGHVSSVAFLQPDSNNLLRYEGHFQIISLTGSCVYSTEVGGPLTKTFKFMISLCKPDGEIFGGNITSSLIAAGLVRLILGTFKQKISNRIKRRQSSGSSTASNIPDSARGDLHKVPRMTKGEIICPTPISVVWQKTSTDGITDTLPLS